MFNECNRIRCLSMLGVITDLPQFVSVDFVLVFVSTSERCVPILSVGYEMIVSLWQVTMKRSKKACMICA